jgi:hypothetical protein
MRSPAEFSTWPDTNETRCTGRRRSTMSGTRTGRALASYETR